MPTFSIISVCLNASPTDIKRTFESLYGQSFNDYEHILIDGISNRKTLTCLREYSDKFAFFLSEADVGIYDAMNKGVEHAQGRYIFFLNIGDAFTREDALQLVANRFETLAPSGGIFCNVNIDDGLDTVYPKRLSVRWLCTNGVSHQSLFARKEIFDKIGGFDLSFRITADNDWLIRAIQHGFEFARVAATLTSVLPGGLSSDPVKVDHDKKSMQRKYYSRGDRLFQPVYYLMSKLLGRLRQGRFHLPPRIRLSKTRNR